jgi:hypothetical protein
MQIYAQKRPNLLLYVDLLRFFLLAVHGNQRCSIPIKPRFSRIMDLVDVSQTEPAAAPPSEEEV